MIRYTGNNITMHRLHENTHLNISKITKKIKTRYPGSDAQNIAYSEYMIIQDCV